MRKWSRANFLWITVASTSSQKAVGTNAEMSHGAWRLKRRLMQTKAKEQFSQYDQWLNDQTADRDVIRVFLTSDGRSCRTSSAEWLPLSFANLAGVFRKEILALRDKPGYHFLRYYLTGVLRNVCRQLPVPIEENCNNPYLANDYLEKVLGPCKLEDGDG